MGDYNGQEKKRKQTKKIGLPEPVTVSVLPGEKTQFHL